MLLILETSLEYLCYATNSSALYNPQTQLLTFRAYPKTYNTIEKQQCSLLDQQRMTVEIKIGTTKFIVNNVLFTFTEDITLQLTSTDVTGIENYNLAVYNMIFTTQNVQVQNIVGIYDYVLTNRHTCYESGVYGYSLIPSKEFFKLKSTLNQCNLDTGTKIYKEFLNNGVMMNSSVENRQIDLINDQNIEWICNQTLVTQPACILMNKNMSGMQILQIEVRLKNLIVVEYQGQLQEFNQTISYVIRSLDYDIPNDCYTAGSLTTDGIAFILKMTFGTQEFCNDDHFKQFFVFDESAIRIVVQNSKYSINVKISDILDAETVLNCQDLKIDCESLKSYENEIVISYLKFENLVPRFKQSLPSTLILQDKLLANISIYNNQICVENNQFTKKYRNFKIKGPIKTEFTSQDGCHTFDITKDEQFDLYIDNQIAHYSLYDLRSVTKSLWVWIPVIVLGLAGGLSLVFIK